MFPADTPTGFICGLLTAAVAFDKHSSLVGIRARLTPETTVPNAVINGAIKCAGSPLGAYFITALMDSLVWRPWGGCTCAWNPVLLFLLPPVRLNNHRKKWHWTQSFNQPVCFSLSGPSQQIALSHPPLRPSLLSSFQKLTLVLKYTQLRSNISSFLGTKPIKLKAIWYQIVFIKYFHFHTTNTTQEARWSRKDLEGRK